MARCESCDLELDEVERFCPGCGEPAPRRVVEVSTALRESFNTALVDDDEDIEYAFGSKRTARTAPPRKTTPSRRSASPSARPARARTPQSPPAPAAEAAELVREPAGEPILEPAIEEPSPAPEVAEIVAETEPEIGADVSLGEGEPGEEDIVLVHDHLDVENEADDQAEDSTELDLAADEEPDVVGEAAAEESTELDPAVDEEPDLLPEQTAEEEPDEEREVGLPAHDEEENVPVAATVAPAGAPRMRRRVPAEERIKPYVVLPVRKPAVVLQAEPEPEPEREPEPVVRRRGSAVAVALALVLVAAGGLAYLIMGRTPTAPGDAFTAEAADHSISLDAPAGWQLESRSTGVLGIGRAAEDTHVHATAIRRSALGTGLSLAGRAKQVQDAFVGSLQRVEASAAQTVNVGPYHAVRRVMTAASRGGQVTYVHTVVKTPKYFVNVLAWAPANRFGETQSDLLGVVGTLQTS